MRIRSFIYYSEKVNIAVEGEQPFFIHTGLKQSKGTAVGRFLETFGFKIISLKKVSENEFQQFDLAESTHTANYLKIKKVNRSYFLIDWLAGIFLIGISIFLDHPDFSTQDKNWMFILGIGFCLSGLMTINFKWLNSMNTVFIKVIATGSIFLAFFFLVSVLKIKIASITLLIIYIASLPIASIQLKTRTKN